MKQAINERIDALREVMRREGLGAFIFPGTDPHNSEYVADHWKGREWISGFDGSAGTAVVTMDAAALWTDSRYFIAAAEQLRGTEFVLMKERVAGSSPGRLRGAPPRWASTAWWCRSLWWSSSPASCGVKAG